MPFLKSIVKMLAPTLLDWVVKWVRDFLKEQERKREKRVLTELSKELEDAKARNDNVEVRDLRALIIGLQKRTRD